MISKLFELPLGHFFILNEQKKMLKIKLKLRIVYEYVKSQANIN